MAIGIYDWALIVDHHLKKATLISYHNIDERLQWLESQTSTSFDSQFTLTTDWQSNISNDEYNEKNC
ncbi:hypothetical protein PROPEN_00363 [Proteus penneri ATCC 35198]|nr:hypothetical protein PROPEN_00363 [Proteus penneri ATCC 35198]